jgi:hypothetical protein
MFFSIVKWVLISLTLILLVHHLYLFLMNTLTVPKIKDLVNKPTQQYKDIFETLQQTHKPEDPTESNTMTAELSSFLNDLKKTKSLNSLANGMGSNGMGSNGMGSNGMGSNGMGSNGMGSNGMGTSGMDINTSDIGYSLY